MGVALVMTNTHLTDTIMIIGINDAGNKGEERKAVGLRVKMKPDDAFMVLVCIALIPTLLSKYPKEKGDKWLALFPAILITIVLFLLKDNPFYKLLGWF